MRRSSRLLDRVFANFRGGVSSRKRSTVNPQLRRRLAFEPLEDRSLLSVAVWNGGSALNHNWITRENWAGDVAPQPGDQLQFAGTARSDYRWSRARAHLKGKDDDLVKVSPLLKIAGNWRRLLTSAASEEEIKQVREHERTGRVLGDEDFQTRLEKRLGGVLRRQKPGPNRVANR
jgi:hypothetical protein